MSESEKRLDRILQIIDDQYREDKDLFTRIDEKIIELLKKTENEAELGTRFDRSYITFVECINKVEILTQFLDLSPLAPELKTKIINLTLHKLFARADDPVAKISEGINACVQLLQDIRSKVSSPVGSRPKGPSSPPRREGVPPRNK